MRFRPVAFFPVLAFFAVSAMGRGSAAQAPPVPDREACAQAYEQSQVLRRSGRLRAARRDLLVCAQQSCPQVVIEQCAQWLKEVDQSLPTVVFAVRDDVGRDRQDVQVWMDDEVLVERLDGTAVAVDPGPRMFQFRFPGGRTVEREVLVRQGEKNRTIEVAWPAAPEPDAALEPAPHPPAPRAAPGAEPSASASWMQPTPMILGGVTLAGMASFAYFGLRARHDVDEMREDCAPGCSSGQVEEARTHALVADVSLGIAIAAAAGAVVVWSTESPESETARVGVGPGSVKLSGVF